MTLYRTENPEYLDHCLSSIHSQSLFPNEIILVQEGELTEKLKDTLSIWQAKFKDLLKIISVSDGTGFPGSLNEGLKNCRYEYIARMDTDDECVNDRFEKQIFFFKNNSNVDLVGSNIDEYDNNLINFLHKRNVPERHEDILKYAKFRCPFNHMTVMYKRKKVLNLDGYPSLQRNEDYALWTMFLQAGYNTANIQDSLVKARTGSNFIKRRSGLKYLKGEIDSMIFIYQNGFYNFGVFLINLVIRITIRLSPRILVKYIYRNFLR